MLVNLASLLGTDVAKGMTTDVDPRDNCIAPEDFDENTDLGDEPDSPRALRSNPTGGGHHKDAANSTASGARSPPSSRTSLHLPDIFDG